MESFAGIWKRAAGRKGGEAALENLLPEIQPPQALREIPDGRWLAEMTRRVFQAGFAWKVVENKWDGFEAAFRGFDPPTVANLSDGDIGRLLIDERIVRNRRKILSVPHNAAWLVELAAVHGTAAAFFADWPDADYVGLLALLKQRGSRLGGFTGMMFLRSMGKDSFFMNEDIVAALVQAGVVQKKATSQKELAAVQEAFNRWREESGRPLAHISRTLACSVGD